MGLCLNEAAELCLAIHSYWTEHQLISKLKATQAVSTAVTNIIVHERQKRTHSENTLQQGWHLLRAPIM